MTMHPDRVVKKTLRRDPDKLAQLQKLLQTTSASEAVRQAIDETLAYSEALRGQETRRMFGGGTITSAGSAPGAWEVAPDLERMLGEALFGTIWRRDAWVGCYTWRETGLQGYPLQAEEPA